MSRSQAVREEALRLDGYRCSICGYDGREEQFRPWVVPHHGVAEDGRKLGMGGSDEQDNIGNVVCLCSTAPGLGLPPNRKSFFGLEHERSCHQLVEDGKILIRNFDPETRTFSVLDIERRIIPAESLWCNRRHDAEEGEQILSQLASFAMLDSTIAERVYRLGQVVDVTDPASRTLRECLASNGLDTRRLIGAANLWEKSLEGLEWPEGMSVSDYRKLRRESGDVSMREYFYVMIPARSWLTGARPEVYYRTAYEQELRDTMEIGSRLYKIGKTVWGLRAEGGKLFDPSGDEVDVVHFVPKEAK